MTTGHPAQIDGKGYLVEPEEWDDALAVELARTQDIALSDDHWYVIRFMRDHRQERPVHADARHATRPREPRHRGRGGRRRVDPFPAGGVAQPCRIAGVRRPPARSTR